MVNLPDASMRRWAWFASRGWRDASMEPPTGEFPVGALRRLGLAPMAHQALRVLGDPRAAELAEDYRTAASRNLALFAKVAAAREVLDAAGIPAVLIKGGAFLVRCCPRDFGTRPMADLDLLVGPDRFDEAFSLLSNAGWRRTSPELKYSSRVSPAVTLSADLGGGAEVQLDLHRHLAQWPLLSGLPAEVLQRSEVVNGWRLPSLADAALVLAVHRARHAFANDARDLVDLYCCIADLDDGDWRHLVVEAGRLGLTAALYGAMRQSLWWFADDLDPALWRLAALRRELGVFRRTAIDRMANISLPLTQSSRWGGPLGRNFGVFPAAFHAPLRSIVAAAVFLPRRVLEPRSTARGVG
jgi:hypothetical protein